MKISFNDKCALFGGAGIGLLFGVIMGTSVTPTVTMMLGALTTLLAAILGLNDQHFNSNKALRIGAFGFACVVGAYMGLYVRAHNVLAPALLTLKAQYQGVGYTEQQALELITLKAFGFSLHTPPKQHSAAISSALSTNIEPNIAMHKQHSSVLFSAPVTLSGCDELVYTDSSLPLDEVFNNFALTGGIWEQFAIELSANFSGLLSNSEQKDMLLVLRDTLCSTAPNDHQTTRKIVASVCENKLHQFTNTDFDFTRLALSESWQKITQVIKATELSQPQKWQLLQLINRILCQPEL
ncbi:hypothetical protein BGP78_01520 [Pseudoalteromonas sp. MSK9-3]|uniref:hypothetical protein n=1 Tax=Pseudoalteromonas sp. MSK9-3 TaxID=1897633 RepID=UPI000E6D2628|nr:hypothetical protein [Pseudoalteromonas sp. MSK9-3]RJE76954.1 hypothetical protein BGP78_01520 [Pseudoalteromonas sp. MSK9-3]